MIVIIGQSRLLVPKNARIRRHILMHTAQAAHPRYSTDNPLYRRAGASERRLVVCDHGQKAHLTRMNKQISSPAPLNS